MFYRHKWLTRQGKLFEPWIAASYKGNFSSSCAKNLGHIDTRIICGNLEEVIKSKSLNKKHRISLRLSTTLIYGTCLLFNKQIEELYDNCCKLFLQTSTKRPYNEILTMISSDDSYNSDVYYEAENEENSSFSDREPLRNMEPAARNFSRHLVDSFDDFVNVDHRPRGINPNTFIGIEALRQSVRKSTRVSSNINIEPLFNSDGSGDPNCPEKDTVPPIEKPPKKKKRQKRRTYRRPTRRAATRKTKKVSAIEKEAEECRELPSPERLRRDCDNDSLMSFAFEWENNEQDHSFKSVGGVNITQLMDKHYMIEPEEKKTSSTPSRISADMVSDASDSQDLNVEDFFSEKGNRRHHHTKSFHVLYPKGMDIKSLKIFAGPISNYGELDQSDVDYSSSTDSSSVGSSTTRDDSLREEFNENGVLSKLLKLWPRNKIVTIRDILNIGSRVTHTGMAAGKIFNSLINLKDRHYVSIIKNEGKIENIIKGRNLVRTCRYHPYYNR